MADIGFTKRVTPADSVVYTVPTGKIARVLACNIADVSSPAIDTEMTMRWFDRTAGGTGTSYQLFTAIRFPANAKLVPLGPGFTMHAEDRLEVVPSTNGQYDVYLALDVTP